MIGASATTPERPIAVARLSRKLHNARDYFNLQGRLAADPICAEEVLGIVHQSREPFMNDAWSSSSRHSFCRFM